MLDAPAPWSVRGAGRERVCRMCEGLDSRMTTKTTTAAKAKLEPSGPAPRAARCIDGRARPSRVISELGARSVSTVHRRRRHGLPAHGAVATCGGRADSPGGDEVCNHLPPGQVLLRILRERARGGGQPQQGGVAEEEWAGVQDSERRRRARASL